MKFNLKKLFIAIVAMAMLTACSDDEKVTQQTQKTKVSFACSVNDDECLDIVGSRAITADGSALTDLAVFDYVGNELKQVVTQTSVDSDFGTPSINLDFGEHRLVFVLSRGTDFSVDDTACKWSKASDTFTKELTLNVTNGTTGQSVVMQRAVSRLALKITDAIPATVKTIRMTPNSFYNDFSTETMKGTTPVTEARVSDLTRAHGRTDHQINWFTLCPSGEEWSISATFAFYDADDNLIATHTKSGIPLLVNRTTVVSGHCFDSSANLPLSVSVNDTWADDYNMNLY